MKRTDNDFLHDEDKFVFIFYLLSLNKSWGFEMHRERRLVLTHLLCVVSNMTGLADKTCLHGEQSGACAAAAPLSLTHLDTVS